MYPGIGYRMRCGVGFPCASRDVPPNRQIIAASYKVPLREQGCTLRGPGVTGRTVGSPARAGMYPSLKVAKVFRKRFPCASRDVPCAR